jgi:SAM-dependent methyltransferase
MDPKPKEMADRLTEASHWEAVYNSDTAVVELPQEAPPTFLRRASRRLLGSHASLTRETYSEFHFWNILLPRYFQADPQRTILEVGSAPGFNLLQFYDKFQYQPFGVEYSSTGAEANRKAFAQKGIDPANVIEMDFFSEAFQSEYRNRFDIVFSRGFIEHFTDVDGVIARHAAVLKPGGSLVVSIPNLNGLNHFMVEKYVPQLLPLHNLTIMNLPVYRKLFSRSDLEPLYCDFQGGIHLLMGTIDGASTSGPVLKLLRYGQVGMNLMQALTGPLDSRWSSPHLLFIGTKRP